MVTTGLAVKKLKRITSLGKRERNKYIKKKRKGELSGLEMGQLCAEMKWEPKKWTNCELIIHKFPTVGWELYIGITPPSSSVFLLHNRFTVYNYNEPTA